ncbi:uncharacterized protein LY79DRAFT_563487 [Colletotrichum navitas]|uniref:Uncharacterized protein n=1 Tax=Colletotrichum navitas TaxID=681940 RepID=A0AAD8PSJ2_9PEZI|nr:uncharacterized protein LY79DRAFT_563487 [Colletotrichum navitas]KAK1579806.1 hypothetical protein LY79DRAFT_563487 [Colletotrichum navitas]
MCSSSVRFTERQGNSAHSPSPPFQPSLSHMLLSAANLARGTRGTTRYRPVHHFHRPSAAGGPLGEGCTGNFLFKEASPEHFRPWYGLLPLRMLGWTHQHAEPKRQTPFQPCRAASLSPNYVSDSLDKVYDSSPPRKGVIRDLAELHLPDSFEQKGHALTYYCLMTIGRVPTKD